MPRARDGAACSRSETTKETKMKLKNYLKDGANKQARAVLCLLQEMTIEESWSTDFHRYTAEPTVARWENCREQGYVVSLRSENRQDQINIAWFEHRNSDSICAVKWEQSTPNAPTIETAQFGNVYADKYDVSHSSKPYDCLEMAEWIEAELQAWWIAHPKPASQTATPLY